MNPCARCNSTSVFASRDIYGEYLTCLTCGWGGETRSEPEELPVRGRDREPRTSHNINPALYRLGAPKPRVNDYETRGNYQKVYNKWYHRNVKTAPRPNVV